MKTKLVDRKSWWSVGILNIINNIALRVHFNSVEIDGLENLPKEGPFILISNHYSRWDPPLIQKILENRRAIYMASPNEMKGLQGALIVGIGAFPAVASKSSYDFIFNQFRKNEVLVVFPEGDVYRDGTTHQFKCGTARIALNCQATGQEIPIVPIGIRYIEEQNHRVAKILIGKAVDIAEYVEAFKQSPMPTIKTLSSRLHREVCHLKLSLGLMHDKATVYAGKPVREWTPNVQKHIRA